ncbi:MiaB-like tRNA modifying enzyme [Thermocrinis albus DSM 14484]|uniref:Threonylcarbamoyladenosine tRNA methylthiotransferase MtaB n=1 Tax=Thermocrinis albus (strain DSM 14484 / JCM 11386 / HI 11/12) TaxID=638303 RepID=D3SN83_THEAH|nr:tRNA (N(6)-L-threonylcarbamoyladenosine(37)-C(2))-methylthiotransferase MtaB [Thermocrinis albus]ADC90213.1 MiaB-like tRNA modifying enzyme [Thermocrinis albus DSM 14484]
MKVRVVNLGCRSNFFDGQFILQKFIEKGYILGDDADIYVVNTCGVTKEAERSSRQAIRRIKRNNPNAVVVVTGCYAQIKPHELSTMEEVDLVVGNTHKTRLVDLVEEYLQGKGQRVAVENIFRQSTLESFHLVTFYERSRPFVKIQEGCNKFCSFCVIPYARGKVRSVPPQKVLEEIHLLAQKGFEEVVITGTQLSQYGWDMGTTLGKLLKEMVKIEGIKLIRLSSLHPAELEEELLTIITEEEKIAPHFHLPLQSGSLRILQLMERGYTPDEYRRLVEKLVEKRPLSAIGTDVIVGFPTETEEDFEETYRFLESLPIAYMHIFPYSDRPFTKASRMEGKVPSSVKDRRVEILKELDTRKRESFRKRCEGKKLRATVLGEGKLLTENYLEIERSVELPAGRVVEVVV